MGTDHAGDQRRKLHLSLIVDYRLDQERPVPDPLIPSSKCLFEAGERAEQFIIVDERELPAVVLEQLVLMRFEVCGSRSRAITMKFPEWLGPLN